MREKRVLVRWFKAPATRDYLRITIGTDAEIDALLRPRARSSRRYQTDRYKTHFRRKRRQEFLIKAWFSGKFGTPYVVPYFLTGCQQSQDDQKETA